MRNNHEELEQVDLTRAEKVLALGLVLFLLVGGLWIMSRLGRIPPRPDYNAFFFRYEIPALEQEVGVLRQALTQAEQAHQQAIEEVNRRGAEYEFRREEYRTSLDAGVDDPKKKQAYQGAEAALQEAKSQEAAARSVLDQRRAALEGPAARLDAARNRAQRDWDAAQRRYDLRVFLLRLAYVLPVLVASLAGWQALRRRRNQFLVIATSFLAFSILQALGLLGVYAWSVFRHVAQLVVSIAGTAVTITGLVILRRYVFNPDRIARARLRRRQCPECGYPVQSDYEFCPDCGAQLASACPNCRRPRPRGLAVCPHCGDGR